MGNVVNQFPKLTPNQEQFLKQEGYDVFPKAKFVKLYANEFDSDVWADYCKEVGVNAEALCLYVVGVKETEE